MLIRNAEIDFGRRCDIRIENGVIADIGELTTRPSDDSLVDADGAALLPGLHDHHVHLLAFAASRESLVCGPPSIGNAAQLVSALNSHPTAATGAWIRGIGYHPAVAGDIDRVWLDRAIPSTPVRIQHRSGRLWVFNSAGLDLLTNGAADSPFERIGGKLTGRLYDGDQWLRRRLGMALPSIRGASQFLLSRGVTGITDASPGNGAAEFRVFRDASRNGDLAQEVLMMGAASLEGIAAEAGISIGHRKIHLREAALPDLDEISTEIARCHSIGRPVAIHCVTLMELVFGLGAFDAAGSIAGDRIEHAGVAPPGYLALIAAHGLTVVTQPNFIAERGDIYLKDVDPADRPWLYRLRGLRQAGIKLAGGTDAPFGDGDPWRAMAAAVDRRTSNGILMGNDEALSPEDALGLFLGAPGDPAGPMRRIELGAAADLCLIDRPWWAARVDLAKVQIAKTFRTGKIVWSR